MTFAIRSSHWKQRTGRKGGQSRWCLWGCPVKYTCWSACYRWVLLWWPVSWDKAGLYLAKTYRWPGATGFGDEYEARASQRKHTGRSGGWYMGLWWQNGWHCDRLDPVCWLLCWRSRIGRIVSFTRIRLAAWVKDALILDWRCLMWVEGEFTV